MLPRSLILAIAAAALIPLAHAEGFDIKTGAWAVTTSTAMSGMPIPKASLDRMPPEQRAKMEAMMVARAGKMNSHTSTTCVTKADLDRGQLVKAEDANCTRKLISQTARRYEMEETCTGKEPSKTHGKFEATSAESYTGSIDRTQGEGKVHVEMSGRWLSATCKQGSER